MVPPIETRPVRESDLAEVARIQGASETAAQWESRDYLAYECRVAECAGAVAGFLVWRRMGDEAELLNLAVAPGFRRKGVARRLTGDLLASGPSQVFLEVRESNAGARAFYREMGFREVGKRPGYYQLPEEAAVVMQWHSMLTFR